MFIYISIIQLCLILQFCLVVFCELTPKFANTAKSIIMRFTLAVSLISLMYYARYLEFVNYPITLSIFFVTLVLTIFFFKYIAHEYLRRTKKAQRQPKQFNAEIK